MADDYAQALAVLSGTPPTLGALVAALPPDVLRRLPSPDGWSPLEVIDHIRNVDAVISARICRMLQEERPLLGPASPPGPPVGDPATTLTLWRTARMANLEWLRGLTEEQLRRVGTHSRYGELTVREHVIEWAYHDLDHLRQIFAAIQAGLYPAIGPFRALYPPPA
jgi:hypothetical protein